MDIILILICILAAVYVIFRFMAMMRMKNAPLAADHEKIVTLTDQNFQQMTKDTVVLVDFWASWCAPCRMMAPVLNEVANELPENIHVGKVDIQQFESLASKYKVRSIPTLIVFKNGQEINRFVGIKSKNYLLKEMDKIS